MPTIDRNIPLLLAFAAALAMVAITGWQGYQLWQAESERTLPMTSTETADQPARAETTPPEVELAKLALFGSASTQNAPSTQNTPEPEAENLPETSLRLVLRGALAADGEFPGSALIENPDGETDVYLAGDSLPGNARLRTVLTNRVIIERGGELENLYFPGTEDQRGIDNSTEPALQSQQRPANRSINDTISGNEARREDIRSRLEQLRQRLQNSN